MREAKNSDAATAATTITNMTTFLFMDSFTCGADALVRELTTGY